MYILTSPKCFNPLPSCEGRLDSAAEINELAVLQSTSLLRGKTRPVRPRYHDGKCFNPLPSCEGRRCLPLNTVLSWMLQSTSLLRGKTALKSGHLLQLNASIHFPLAREDNDMALRALMLKSFNPLPSCEGRPAIHRNGHGNQFQASIHFPLAREDEAFSIQFSDVATLQSTSLLRGKTRRGWPLYILIDALQSTSLLRGKTSLSGFSSSGKLLQSTSLLRGKTHQDIFDFRYCFASIHFPLAREDFF